MDEVVLKLSRRTLLVKGNVAPLTLSVPASFVAPLIGTWEDEGYAPLIPAGVPVVGEVVGELCEELSQRAPVAAPAVAVAAPASSLVAPSAKPVAKSVGGGGGDADDVADDADDDGDDDLAGGWGEPLLLLDLTAFAADALTPGDAAALGLSPLLAWGGGGGGVAREGAARDALSAAAGLAARLLWSLQCEGDGAVAGARAAAAGAVAPLLPGALLRERLPLPSRRAPLSLLLAGGGDGGGGCDALVAGARVPHAAAPPVGAWGARGGAWGARVDALLARGFAGHANSATLGSDVRRWLRCKGARAGAALAVAVLPTGVPWANGVGAPAECPAVDAARAVIEVAHAEAGAKVAAWTLLCALRAGSGGGDGGAPRWRAAQPSALAGSPLVKLLAPFLRRLTPPGGASWGPSGHGGEGGGFNCDDAGPALARDALLLLFRGGDDDGASWAVGAGVELAGALDAWEGVLGGLPTLPAGAPPQPPPQAAPVPSADALPPPRPPALILLRELQERLGVDDEGENASLSDLLRDLAGGGVAPAGARAESPPAPAVAFKVAWARR